MAAREFRVVVSAAYPQMTYEDIRQVVFDGLTDYYGQGHLVFAEEI